MAVTTHKPQSAKPAARKAAGAVVKQGARHPTSRKPARAAAKAAVRQAPPPPDGLRPADALRAAAESAVRWRASVVELARSATDRAFDAAATDSTESSHRRPPIQVAVDAAVPVRVAWSEWMRLRWIPDPAGPIAGVRVRNGVVRGKLGSRRWAAEIVEEHPDHSFAWRTSRGSDCAGVITFHPLSKRLTRIELTLDTRPERFGDAFRLTLRAADRRTRAQMRRFKARLELISPEDYGEAPNHDD